MLTDLLNTPVTVASYVPLPIRKSPGIITLIRRDEIQSSGAKDLMDVLRAQAGFEFASDTQGAVGVGFRGNFGHYGKILLLIDGQEMNETQYGTTQIGWHYPIFAVEKIEIIRGPGSVLYGGYAECAVIKVTTARGAQMDGAGGSLLLATMNGRLERQANVHYGKAWSDSDFSLSYSAGLGLRGQGTFPLTETSSAPVDRLGQLGMDFLNIGYRAGNLDLRFIRDSHLIRDYTQEVLSLANPPMTFRSDYLSLAYAWEFGNWTFLPHVSVKEQAPWYYTYIGTLSTTRSVGGLNAKWKAGTDLNFTFGAEGTWDHAIQYRRPPTNPKTGTYNFNNQTLLAQMQWSPGWFSVDAGLRMDKHSQFGVTYSPRFAILHAEQGWHLKFLASGAFCAPAIAELRDNPDLRPERTTTFELEFGQRLGTSTYATANLFWVQIRNPISYLFVPGEGDVFTNLSRTGTRGLELESQTRLEQGWIKASVCYAQALGPETEDPGAYWDIPTGHRSYHVGLPSFKWTLQGHLQVTRSWFLDGSLIHLGSRYGYRLNEIAPSRFDPLTLVNIFATCRIPHFRRLELGFGVSNFLGAENPTIQGYGDPAGGGNPPIPGPGREFSLRLNYGF